MNTNSENRVIAGREARKFRIMALIAAVIWTVLLFAMLHEVTSRSLIWLFGLGLIWFGMRMNVRTLTMLDIEQTKLLESERRFTEQSGLSTKSDIHELQACKENFQAITAAFDGFIYICSPDRSIIFMNEKLIERTGRNAIGEPCFEVIHGLESACTWCVNGRAFKNETVRCDLQCPEDGNWYQVIHSPILHGNGTVSSLVLMQDITERICEEEKLADLVQEVASHSKLVESVITNLHSGIIVIDLDYRITLANSYVIELCGIDYENHVGRPLADISPELYDNVRAGTKVNELTVNFCGSQAVIGYNRVDLADASGEIIGYIISFKDLTEIVRIRKELRQKERLSSMGEALAGVAHEMRNPLFGITSAAQILEMELKLNTDQKKLMWSLLNAAHRLNKIVEELLDTTREMRIIKTRVNLISLLDESLGTVESLFKERRITLRKCYDGEIWISADLLRVQQVIINIVTNAIEACKPSGHIYCEVSLTEKDAVVKITDSGEGILPENLDRVFDLFFTTKKNGTGLGLSICRTIIEAHGGSLTASNNPEGGAQFVIQLPLGEHQA